MRKERIPRSPKTPAAFFLALALLATAAAAQAPATSSRAKNRISAIRRVRRLPNDRHHAGLNGIMSLIC